MKREEFMDKTSYTEQFTIIFLFFASMLLFVFQDYPSNLIKEIRNSEIPIVMFVSLLFFSLLSENFNIKYIKKSYHASIIPAVTWLIWVGPYSAAIFSSLVTVFLAKEYDKEMLSKPLGITKRFSIRLIMFSIPVFFVGGNNFALQIFIYILIVEAVRYFFIDLFFPLIEKRKNTYDRNTVFFMIFEIVYPLILIPLFYVVYTLKISGYRNFNLLFLLFPFFMASYFMVAKFYLTIITEKNEKKRISRFKNGLESVLNTLKLMHSTENSEDILGKSIKFLSEALEFRSSAIYVLDTHDKKFRHTVSYGEELDKNLRKFIAGTVLTEFEDVLQNQYYFGGAYFIPRESITLKNLIIKYNGNNSYDEKDSAKDKYLPKLWKSGDLFLIPLTEKGKNISGFVVMDIPANGNRPNVEDAEIATIFAEQMVRILESSQKYSQIVEKSQRDNMTGLYNHSHFYELLQNKLDCVKPNSPLSMIMFDIDNFKKLNDTYGHITGDKVLIMVAETILKNIPKNAFPARYGGEEFAVLIENSGKLAALEIANELIGKIRKIDCDGIRVTVSGGIASAPEDGCHTSILVAAADGALYVSKKSGKDRITLA